MTSLIDEKTRTESPEWQARQDWRREGVFRPWRLTGSRARRYRREARRILREARAGTVGPLSQGGCQHVRANRD